MTFSWSNFKQLFLKSCRKHTTFRELLSWDPVFWCTNFFLVLSRVFIRHWRSENSLLTTYMPTLPDYPGVSRIRHQSPGLPYKSPYYGRRNGAKFNDSKSLPTSTTNLQFNIFFYINNKIRPTSTINVIINVWNMPHQQKFLFSSTINIIIITITKLSNLIGYQLPWFQP